MTTAQRGMMNAALSIREMSLCTVCQVYVYQHLLEHNFEFDFILVSIYTGVNVISYENRNLYCCQFFGHVWLNVYFIW